MRFIGLITRALAQIKRASDKGARSQNAEGEDCDGLIDTWATHSISRSFRQSHEAFLKACPKRILRKVRHFCSKGSC